MLFFIFNSYFIITNNCFLYFFFFNDTATTEIYTLSLHDALPNSFSAAGSMAAGFPAPTAAVVPSSGIIANAPNQSFAAEPKDLPIGYVESWNVAIQRSLPGSFSAEAAFVGNHGIR